MMSLKIRYSEMTGSFYPLDIDYGDTLPTDAIAVDWADFDTAMKRPLGHTFHFVDGRLIIAAPEPTPFADQAAAYLGAVRASRDDILNRIAGVGFAAMQSADSELVQAVIAARQALLDITTVPNVVAATDSDALAAAIHDAYLAIIESAPERLLPAFTSGIA
ncbi:hypothetical protein [Janthinobacterium sp. BJB401]|uniref:hypothetical protein n=1 Tax=Janthinobacterium sp. BJB401 TaxID=2745934 RepID=UPI00159544EA|nr:hypothetical protein [Janthinobacterium sp. BJB401]NVI81927.1 hypothetical protein [Janthinobacterium sp. BJB401]